MGMLILSRRRGEKVLIIVPPSSESTVIEASICDIRGVNVRTGYNAPQEVQIHREEVYRAIQKEKQSTAK